MKSQIKSQWDCLLQNLGAWHGSFTRLSPLGEVLEDTPTLTSLEGLNQNRTIHHIVRRFTPDPIDTVLEYSSLGRGILLFENGAFSQGAIQFGPFSEFGAELGLIAGDRRLRLVQLFNRDSQLDRLTLIREKLPDSSTPERPALQMNDLVGEWQGEAVTLYPDWRNPDTYATRLTVERQGDQLTQELRWGDGGAGQPIASTGTIAGSRISFGAGTRSMQVLLLPDGASATSPTQIQSGQGFFLEVGWLLQPNLRQRMIRSYSDRGEWVSLTLVTEQKS